MIAEWILAQQRQGELRKTFAPLRQFFGFGSTRLGCE